MGEEEQRAGGARVTRGRVAGEVQWNATEGTISFYVAHNRTLTGGASISFALNIHR